MNIFTQIFLVYAVNCALLTPTNIWAKEGNLELNQAHTLTLDDVSFDKSTGRIKGV